MIGEPPRWLTRVLNALLLFGLVSCVLLLLRLVSNSHMAFRVQAPTIVAILFFYILAICTAAIMWRQLVQSSMAFSVSWRDTLVGIAALMLGKYVPGKVAGLAGRALTVGASRGMISASLIAVIEQGYVVAGLIIFASLATLVFAAQSPMYEVWIWVSPIVLVVAVFGPRIGTLCVISVLKRNQFVSDLVRLLGGLTPAVSLFLLTLSVIAAAAVCAPAWFLSDILSIDTGAGGRSVLLAAYAVSIVAGMLALVLPGGIGAREGVFVLMTQSVLTLEVAIAAAALLRVINVMADLLVGLCGVLAWKLRSDSA